MKRDLELLETLTPLYAKQNKRQKRLFGGIYPNENNALRGSAQGWAYYITGAYARSLGMRLGPPNAEDDTEDQDDSTKTVWTQGSRFCFSEGSMMYDTPKCRQVWREALKCISEQVQVTSGTPAVPAAYKRYRYTDADVKKAEAKGEELTSQGWKVELIHNPNAHKWNWFLDKYYPRNPGFVRFKVQKPNSSKTGLGQPVFYTTTQDDFVRMLITGDRECMT